MHGSRAHVSLFTRLPVPGEAKTRLIPALGAEEAARVHAQMTEHAARQLRLLRAQRPASVEVRIAGGSARDARRWLGLPATEQGAGSLGDRMARAIDDALAHTGVAAVVGADCPNVDAADIATALSSAEESGAAIIPADDGGYCLLAVRADNRGVVRAAMDGVEWGGGQVAQQQIERLRAHGVEPTILPKRADVDRPEDVPEWERVRAAWYGPPERVSVVIPALNEAAVIGETVAIAVASACEVIVSDGGSSDATRDLAAEAGASVVFSPRGRGAQLDAGAASAAGDALVFLHADTKLPSGFADTVCGALADPALVVGAFRFALDGRGMTLRLLEAGTRIRGSLLHFPYGDQALFCRRVVWRALGGFPDWPVMEDYEFVSRARRAGLVRVVTATAVTSARRWREYGPWRWTALNVATVARYRSGVTPEELERWRAGYSKR